MESIVTIRVRHEPMDANQLAAYVRGACDWRLDIVSIEAKPADTILVGRRSGSTVQSTVDAMRAAHEQMQARNAESTRRQAEHSTGKVK